MKKWIENVVNQAKDFHENISEKAEDAADNLLVSKKLLSEKVSGYSKKIKESLVEKLQK